MIIFAKKSYIYCIVIHPVKSTQLLSGVNRQEAMKTKNTVLIITKDPNSRGGVSNYYNLFFKYYSDEDITTERFVMGSRANVYYSRLKRNFLYAIYLLYDLYRLVNLLITRRDIKIVKVNPSLIPLPLFTNGIVLMIAKIFRKKTIVFYRGWNEKTATKLSNNTLFNRLFTSVFNDVNASIVLADIFKKELIDIGIKNSEIHVSRTMYEKKGVNNPNKSKNKKEKVKFLYLSRISKEKGIWELLKSAKVLHERGFNFLIKIHGHGANDSIITELQDFILNENLKNCVEIGPFLQNEEKYKAYSNSDIFILPTFHPEGCPNSVIEAMGFGCFVISTTIGAIPEIVKDGINGSIVDTKNVNQLIEKMEYAITNPQEIKEKGRENIKYAYTNFEINVIITQINLIYKSVIKNKNNFVKI